MLNPIRALGSPGAAAAFVLLAAVLMGWPSGEAAAQSNTISETGPTVVIEASGERIRAAGASVTVEGTAESVEAAGASVTVDGTFEDDVSAAGALVDFRGEARGDLKVGGATVEVRGRIGDDVYIGGAVVLLNAVVNGDAKIGGADVTIGPGTNVQGNLKVGGANVTLTGIVGGSVEIAAANANFNARTPGDVTVYGGQLTVGPRAEIGGDLIVQSVYDPEISEDAEIGGELIREDPDWWPPDVDPWLAVAGLLVLVAIGTILTGIVAMLFGGRVFTTSVDNVRMRPGSSLLLGIANVVLIPFVAVILMATVAGLTVGFAILLILPIFIVFGHATAAAGVVSAIFVRDRSPIGIGRALLFLVIGAVALALVPLIPWVGPILLAIVLLIGIGAFGRTVGARLRRTDPQPV